MNRRTAERLDFGLSVLPFFLFTFAALLTVSLIRKLPWLFAAVAVATVFVFSLIMLTLTPLQRKRRKARGRLYRRRGRALVVPNILRRIDKFEAAGKWLASASGVAIGLGVALMITAYGALIPQYNECVTLHAASQSIQRGRQMVVWFTGCGVFGLAAAILPSIVALANLWWPRLRPAPSRKPDPSYKAEHDLSWMRQDGAAFLAQMQFALLACWLPIFALGLAVVIDVAGWQTPENLLTFQHYLRTVCGELPAP